MTTALGVGCRRHCPSQALRVLVDEALASAGLKADDIIVLATLESKTEAPAILDLAEHYGWPAQGLPVARLAHYEHRLTHKSDAARRAHGVAGVAEAAALAALENDGGTARLLLPRCHNHWATVAIAIESTPDWRAS